MKRKKVFLMMALMAVTVTGFLGCSKNYIIRVSTQNLWFGLEAETQTLEITANCEWTITRNDNADWYTISQMSGKKDGVISVTVEALEDGDYRGSTFVISSPGGHVRRTIFVSQNKLDFDGMVNKVFGVMELEHWNTDFFDQMIEDSYQHAILTLTTPQRATTCFSSKTATASSATIMTTRWCIIVSLTSTIPSTRFFILILRQLQVLPKAIHLTC